jgi:hypothetical protein
MRLHPILSFIILTLMILPAWGQDTVDPSDGPSKITVDNTQTFKKVPVDEKTGMIDWDRMGKVPEGPGAMFAFMAALFPPDPASLADLPKHVLDTAWLPVIPFSWGYSPSFNHGQITTQGWWYIEDTSCNLARRDMTVTDDTSQIATSTWFLGGTKLFYIEEGQKKGYSGDSLYPPDEWTGGGIEFFLKTVWFKGVLRGQKMQDLLTECSAEQIGRDLIRGNQDRVVIYRIRSNENDRQNGRGNLLVWVTLGEWRLVRTRLNTVYATEMTEFRNILPDIQNTPETYYSDFLPPDYFWSINNYLTVHEGPFWVTPPADQVVDGVDPLVAGLGPSGDVPTGAGKSDDATGSDKSGDSGKSDGSSSDNTDKSGDSDKPEKSDSSG